jgi:hypothetical protein
VKKIPTLFIRDEANPRLVTRYLDPDCEWVVDGEGVATRKFDGTACLVQDGRLFKRLEWDAGKGDAPPQWLHHDFDRRVRSGHGWYPIGDGPEDWIHRLVSVKDPAVGDYVPCDSYGLAIEDGTYELCGPKVNKNPEGLTEHALLRHGSVTCKHVPRAFDGLIEWLSANIMEGIVWHHPDGRMAKIKARDFGIRWPRAAQPETSVHP